MDASSALPRVQNVAEHRLRQQRAGLVAQVNHHRVVAGRGFRCNPLLAAPRKHQKRAFRSCMIDRGTHQGIEQLFENHLARNCLRHLDDGSKVEVLDHWCTVRGRPALRANRNNCDFFAPRTRGALINYLLQ